MKYRMKNNYRFCCDVNTEHGDKLYNLLYTDIKNGIGMKLFVRFNDYFYKDQRFVKFDR